jgi:hypothetical protein
MQNMDFLCAACSGSPILFLAGVLMILVGLRDLARCTRAYWRLKSTERTWSSTTGRIVSGEALGTPFHSLNVRYEYSARGQRYAGTRISDGAVVIPALRIEMVLKGQFSAGREVKVFYNRLNPAYATLDLELRPPRVRDFMVGSLFMVMGSGLISGSIWFWIMLLRALGD